jgi:transcriptional regulator with XRE-family HTH domain
MNIETLKYCRQLAGYTQKELAEKVGITDSYISKIEAEKVPLPSEIEIKILQVLSDAGISRQDFILIQGIFQSRTLKTVKKDWTKTNG